MLERMSCNGVRPLLTARDEVREDLCRHAAPFQISAKSVQDTDFTRLLDGVAKEHVYKLSAHLLPNAVRRCIERSSGSRPTTSTKDAVTGRGAWPALAPRRALAAPLRRPRVAAPGRRRDPRCGPSGAV